MLRLMLVLAMSLLLVNSATAQDDTPAESPLMHMLARVPDMPESRAGEIYFNDRVAITQAYEGAVMPETWAEFDALNEDDEDPNAAGFGRLVWWRIYLNNASSQFGQNIGLGGEMEQVTGFDFFDVDRELFYGRAPATGVIVDGEFNLDAVRDAYATLGLVESSTEGGELWCSEDGCDAGFDTNLAERNRAIPFGGDFGRRQPLVLGDGYLMSSADSVMVEAHIEAISGAKTSLADVPEYAAGVEAISQFGPLMQAMILDGEFLLTIREDIPLVSALGERATREQVQEAIRAQLGDFQELPVYQLMLLGDSATEDEHISLVALVYDDAETAELAGGVIQDRINTYLSVRVSRSMLDVLADRYLDVETHVYESSGLAVLLVEFATPKATPEEIIVITDTTQNSDALERTFPGAGYRLLTQMTFSRDLGWLSTVTRADLEALLDD